MKTTSLAALPTSKRLHFDDVRRRIPCVRYKLQYCRVPKNGLPKNGQAGIYLKRRTTPGWKNELRTVSPHANNVSCEEDFFGGIADFETTPLRRRASSHTVCALQANLRDSKTDWKLRTRLAGVVKNKNDPGWDRLPPVLRHPKVLYPPSSRKLLSFKQGWPSYFSYLWFDLLYGCRRSIAALLIPFSHHTSSQFCKAQRFGCRSHFQVSNRKRKCQPFYLLLLVLELSGRCDASSRRSCANVTFGVDVSVFCNQRSVSSVTTKHEDGKSKTKKGNKVKTGVT